MNSKARLRLRGGRNLSRLQADFETTKDGEGRRVWLWGLVRIDDVDAWAWGTSMNSFTATLEKRLTHVYFHNLRYDGVYLLDWLLKQGYVWVKEDPVKGQFTTLISAMNQFYSIDVRWMGGGKTEFRDSLKKLPFKVADISKAFGLNAAKGDLDYSRVIPVGYEPTVDDLEYLYNDLIIPSQALLLEFEQGMTKLTVGSDSLAEFKKLFGHKRFDRFFPQVGLDIDGDIRSSYKGGFTFVNPRFAQKMVGEGSVYDVNSLYPYVMDSRLLPYGEPEHYEGPPPVEGLYIANVTFTARLKEDHIPCIQIKGSWRFSGTEYISEIKDPVTLQVTNVDWELWNDHYHIHVVSFNGGYSFQGAVGFFGEYIEKWMGVKENSEGGLKTLAKLHLNSLYGKFATNPDCTGRVPTLVDGVVKLVMGDEESRNPVYTAMGSFITAYARDITIRAAQLNFDRFIYADTDSLHLVGREAPLGVEVHKSHLGAWKKEYEFDKGLFWRAKQYSELRSDTGEMETHIAGLPHVSQKLVRFEDYFRESEFTKLQQKHVVGGVDLVEVTFKLRLDS